jgi:hypothetical protein
MNELIIVFHNQYFDMSPLIALGYACFIFDFPVYDVKCTTVQIALHATET